MKKSIMKKWVAALRSGEFKQGQGLLHNQNENTHCCLGVLSDIALIEGVCETSSHTYSHANATAYGQTPNSIFLCHEVQDWAGMKSPNGESIAFGLSLAGLNDRQFPFSQIADIIEQNYKDL